MSRLLFLFPSIFLFCALLDGWPYVYFQILRWVVCAFAAYFAYISFDGNRKIWAGVFAVIAVLFNPILPFYMSRSMWQPIDAVTGILFCVYGIMTLRKRS